MRLMMAFLFGLSLTATPSAAQTRKTLDIYLIDVEGVGDLTVMNEIDMMCPDNPIGMLHFSLLSGQESTVPNLFIANGIDKVSAQQDGTFTVTNTQEWFRQDIQSH